MKWTEDGQRKASLANELFWLFVVAGLKVKDVAYRIEDGEEVYVITMTNNYTYRVNVTCDSPMTAVYDVVNFMKNK
ncbi:hypothetical protein [Ruminococcus sp. 210702-SL.1.03]|jgi:hypothetical protein|uniref:hypothetical protein n=1 Tax=Ruminococcus sp. 210702-SL.1.03 TaxID=2883233 RepID=UPI001D083F4A|nr:hypothetical protein [Ruminococcus sp. 210702-SL.1.03]MCB6616935.1 hypothetical protein [Ruminococcus sp. 210702-SL.1.03]